MKRVLYTLGTLLARSVTVHAADDVASAVAGTIKKSIRQPGPSL